ncbi:transketolase family protein [Patescibacteria group bacterium]|jgi:transketolase|nr:transketolase family protein [Patescibacteria group bacterium]
MIRTDAHLHADALAPDALEQGSTRDGFGMGVVAAGLDDPRVVVLCADLAESTRSHWFQEKFPERYIEVGVAEQNLATVASGLANYGKIPFITSYAAFSPGRNYEQLRTTVCLNHVPVKVMGMHAGISVGPDGATHQPLEDIGLMRMLPRMTVVVPADVEEAKKATIAAAATGEPIYIRFGRAKTPIFTTPETPFAIGQSYVMWEGEDPEVALIACGSVAHNALLAAEQLAQEGVSTVVLNNHTVKPMDESAVIDLARRTGAVVTIEEHQVSGGMGSAVAEVLAHNHPTPMQMVGVHDQFGQSGAPAELIEHYGMGVGAIKAAVHAARAQR